MRVMNVYEIEFGANSTYLVPALSMNEAITRAVDYIGAKDYIRKVEIHRHIALVEG